MYVSSKISELARAELLENLPVVSEESHSLCELLGFN